jgi:hypothetical protein
MQLPDEVKVKIVEFVSKYPFPITNDEDAANWTHELCQQLKFSFPNHGWGHKKADENRPHSADVIATESPFMGWDIISNAGSPSAKLNLDASSLDLANPPDGPQVFEPVVANNFLDVVTPPVPPTNGTVDEKLDMIISMLQRYHTEEMDAITAPRVTRMG